MSGVTVALDGVSRRFGRRMAVADVSFELRPGEVLGLLGPNGAGKTTTMRVLTGYLRPSSGRVLIDGRDAAGDPMAVRAVTGYVPEGAPVPRDLTVSAYLRYCARLRGLPRAQRGGAVESVVRRAGLADVAGQVVGTLSRGYRQRVAVAQALVGDPPVLVLDEPTTGLDPRQVTDTRALIARLGRRHSVLLSSHQLAEVSQLCRRVVVLDAGRVVTVREVGELVASTGLTRLILRVGGDERRAAEILAGVAGVDSAVVRGATVVVTGRGADLAARVSASVVGAGLALVELRSDAGTLEDAYLRLVGG